MMSYGNQELEEMLLDIESDLVERKETFRGDAPTTVREAVCAFANDLPDHRRLGVVFVGARDNGTPTGLPVTDELLRQLARYRNQRQHRPPPNLDRSQAGAPRLDVAIVTVWPADSPPVVQRPGLHPHRPSPRHSVCAGRADLE